jgi:hypothetical protein
MIFPASRAPDQRGHAIRTTDPDGLGTSTVRSKALELPEELGFARIYSSSIRVVRRETALFRRVGTLEV